MAIITISREVAALGDEVAEALAKKIGYKFVNRKYIEKRIVELGFAEEKMKKYDERKPSFFASLVKDRDEYLDYLRTAVLEAANEGNCILIGRGSFAVLEDVPNLVAVRFVANDTVRVERLKKEFNWDEKQALQRIVESDQNRRGFHRNFFNIDIENPSHYHVTINTGLTPLETTASIVADIVKDVITEQKEIDGKKKIAELYEAQLVVKELRFTHKVNINFLRAVIENDELVLQGVADSVAIAEKAVSLAKEIAKDRKVVSAISIIQDFKSYP